MFEKEAKTKLSEEDYKLAEETIKPIYRNAIKNDYSFAKYGVECYLTGYNKANEWHYVKDGDLPKKDGMYLFYLYDKTDTLDYFCEVFDISDTDKDPYIETSLWDIEDVIAWKEIVLPKESE